MPVPRVTPMQDRLHKRY